MSSGPSKQELEMYWNNSRQYFDELANHYRQTDPEYYKKYIAPFYANPFVSQPQTYGMQQNPGSAGGGKTFSVVIALVLLIAGISAAAYFMIRSENYSEEQSRSVEKETQQQEQKTDTEPEIDKTEPEENPVAIEPSAEYEKGLEYFSKKEFDKAEEHLKKVPADDSNYKNAQRMLKFIRANKESGRDNYRKKPIERVR